MLALSSGLAFAGGHLAARPALVDFGPVAANTGLNTQVVLRNSSDSRLDRVDIDAPCHIQWDLSRSGALDPGEETVLSLALESGTALGEQRTQVFAQAPGSDPVSIAVQHEVRNGLVLFPPALTLSDEACTSAVPVSSELRVLGSAQAGTIEAIDPSRSDLRARAEPLENGPSPGFRILVSLAKPVDAVASAEVVSLLLSGFAERALDLPVMIVCPAEAGAREG